MIICSCQNLNEQTLLNTTHLNFKCGKCIPTIVEICQSQHNANFNFDLERMQQVISSPTIPVPDNLSFNEFCDWVKQHKHGN